MSTIIIIIKDAKLVLIKNWRPLTLLNCDYKIASKAISSCIKTFLPKVISDDQTGFLKGRCIRENIRLLDAIIKYTEGRNIPGLLLFISFEKAFDTLEWFCISKTLQHFVFGLNWIKLFYCNIESEIKIIESSVSNHDIYCTFCSYCFLESSL